MTELPSQKLLEEWELDWLPATGLVSLHVYMARRASQWARDDELDACCRAIEGEEGLECAATLRLLRRPPATLKQRALEAARIELDPSGKNGSLILRALEALPDD